MTESLLASANVSELAFRVKSEKGADAEIYIYDRISRGWDGIGASDIAGALKEIEAAGHESVTVRFNSEGGNIMDGTAIYNLFTQSPLYIKSQVDGWAASAAALIAMAGDEIAVADNGFLMLHEGHGRTEGRAKDHRDTASLLDKLNEGQARVFAARMGKDLDEVLTILDAETWYSGPEAMAAGLSDSVMPAKRKNSAAAPTVNAERRTHFLAQCTNFPGGGESPQPLMSYTVTTTGNATVVEKDPEMSDPKIEELQAQLAKQTALASFSDAEKAHLGGLNAALAESFLSMSASQREKEMAKDAVAYTATDGTVYRQSDRPELVAKARDLDARQTKLDAEAAKLKHAELVARANTEFASLPGDPEHKALLLGAIEAMPEASKTGVLKLVIAGEKAMQSTFSAIGHGPHDDAAPGEDQIEALAKAYKAEKGGSLAQAYKAVMATPEGQAIYNSIEAPKGR